MYALNRATIIGNITRDPELRYTPNGQAVTSFSVATNRRWKSPTSSEYQEATEYHDLVAWGKAAEFVSQYMKKGNKIYVDGRLQTRSWETPDGVKQRRTEIVVENFVPLTPKGSAGAGPDYDSMADLAPDQTGGEVDQLVSGTSSSSKPAGKTTGKAAAKSTTPPAEDEINLEDIPF